jgi:hypothetical protein
MRTARVWRSYGTTVLGAVSGWLLAFLVFTLGLFALDAIDRMSASPSGTARSTEALVPVGIILLLILGWLGSSFGCWFTLIRRNERAADLTCGMHLILLPVVILVMIFMMGFIADRILTNVRMIVLLPFTFLASVLATPIVARRCATWFARFEVR